MEKLEYSRFYEKQKCVGYFHPHWPIKSLLFSFREIYFQQQFRQESIEYNASDLVAWKYSIEGLLFYRVPWEKIAWKTTAHQLYSDGVNSIVLFDSMYARRWSDGAKEEGQFNRRGERCRNEIRWTNTNGKSTFFVNLWKHSFLRFSDTYQPLLYDVTG